MTRIYVANLVQAPKLGSLEILHDRLIHVDDKGFIAAIVDVNSSGAQANLEQSRQSNPTASPVHLPATTFLLPTFVDLHHHAPQYLYQGTGLHLPLMKWLDAYAYKAEERLDADGTLARKVYERLAERLLEAGTGTILAFGTIKTETNMILAETMQSKGIRAFVGKLSMDISSRPTYIEPSAEEALSDAKSFISRCTDLVHELPEHERLVQPAITPRFVPTCSDGLLTDLGKLSEENGVTVQSHLAEARDQVDWVRSTRGDEDINMFDKHGLLNSRTIQAHCTFLEDEDFKRLVQKGTAIAHCPLSNAYFSTKQFRLREALTAGVKVGLGTDVAGGYSVEIQSAMRSAVYTSRVREGQRVEDDLAQGKSAEETGTNVSIDWIEAIHLATKGGAEALGLRSGQFEVGRPFDAQQIDLADSKGQGLGSLDFLDGTPVSVNEETVEKWWCVGDVRNRSKVWVQGKEVYSSN